MSLKPTKKSIGDIKTRIVFCEDCKYAHLTHEGECKYCDFFQPDGGDALYLPVGSFCSNGKPRKDLKK